MNTRSRIIAQKKAQKMAQQLARVKLELAAKNGNLRAHKILERWDANTRETDRD